MNSETLLPRSIKAEMDWGRQRKGGGSIATAREAEIQHFNDQRDQQVTDEMSRRHFGTICSRVKLLFRGTHHKNKTMYSQMWSSFQTRLDLNRFKSKFASTSESWSRGGESGG